MIIWSYLLLLLSFTYLLLSTTCTANQCEFIITGGDFYTNISTDNVFRSNLNELVVGGLVDVAVAGSNFGPGTSCWKVGSYAPVPPKD